MTPPHMSLVAANTVSNVEEQLRIIADALTQLCELANEDGTIGDYVTQGITERVFAMSLDEAVAEICTLNDRDGKPNAAWLVLHGAEGSRQLLGSARSHDEALGLIADKAEADTLSMDGPILIIEIPFGSDTVNIHDGDGIAATVSVADFMTSEPLIK